MASTGFRSDWSLDWIFLTLSDLYKCVCGSKNVEPKSRSAIVSTSSINIVDNGLSYRLVC